MALEKKLLDLVTRKIKALGERALEINRIVELVDEIPEGLPLALADRVKVRQVLFNLLANAAKFTPSGSIRLRASASEAEILVEVSDTGIGMDPEDIPRAFAEFVQLDDDMDRRVGGSGLGLTLAQTFVQQHQGTIECDSRPGRTCFTIMLPLE